MKTITKFLLTCAVLLLSNHLDAQTVTDRSCSLTPAFCNPSFTGHQAFFQLGIKRVIFGSIDNTTSVPGQGDPTLHDFTCTEQTTITAGVPQSITVTNFTHNQEDVKVYIDYNNDGDFNDPGELAFSSDKKTSHTGSITAPLTAVNNTVLRMRVLSDFFDNGVASACENIDFGQVEEYGVTVLVPVITSTIANQAVNDDTTIDPFSGVVLTILGNPNVTATITLDNNAKGTLSGTDLVGSGPYTIASKSLTDMQATIRALTFTPTENRTSTTETTTFTITIDDGTTVSNDSNTTVISSAVGPTITGVSIPNTPMKIGDVVTATITVDSDTDNYTSGLGGISGTIGGFALGNLSRTNATTYTAAFTVTDGGTDVAAGSDIPVSVTLTDSGGKAGNTFGTAISQNSDAIDANRPELNSIVITDTALISGETTLVTFTFSEVVTGFTNADIMIPNGTLTNVSSADGGTTYTATFTPSSSVEDITNVFTIDKSGVADNAGNSGSGTTDSGNFTIDTAKPTVTITSSANPTSGAFTATFTFSEDVTGFAIGDITVGNGTAGNLNNTSASVYTATITPSVEGAITIDVAADQANDTAGNGNTAANQLSVTNDITKPTVTITSNASSPQSGAFTATFTFSEDVTGFVVGDITVGNGSASNFSSTSASVYSATITPSANGAVTVDVAADIANDTAGNGNTSATQLNVTNDETSPSVLEVTSDATNGTYGVGDMINIYVQYDEEVFVTGAPQLTLETGTTDRVISYADRSVSTLRFVYTVQSGDESADLDVVSSSALTLNSGTIKDAAGNNANLVVQHGATSGSLSQNKDIVINAAVPTVSTTDATSIAQFSANLGGNVTDGGGSTVTERGVVYAITSTNSNPEIGGTGVTKDTNGTGINAFGESINGLSNNTQYSFRAYAINSSGTVYGSVKTFTTLDLVAPTITFADINKTYGDADFSLGATANSGGTISYTIIGTANGTSLSGMNNALLSLGNVATVTIRATVAANGIYTGGTKDATLTIEAKPITVTADVGQSKIYGDSDPVYTYTITTGSLESGDSFSGVLTRVVGENVGKYVINQGTLTAGPNYDLTYASNDFNITQRAITVTANTGQTKVYGDVDPVFAYSITSGSLVTGDNFSGALTRVVGENVGNYAINQGTLTAGSNYDLSYVSNNFNITQKGITVTADMGQTKVYGDSDPAFTYAITSGSLETGDSFTGTLTRVVGENVGDYAINQGTLTAGSNYNVSYVPNDFSITQKAITVTADVGQTKVYGDSDLALTYAITSGSLVSGDSFTGVLARAVGEDVGAYAINQGTLSLSSNYNLSFVSNNFTITQRAITITVNAGQTKVYGNSDPSLTYAITSGNLVSGDSFSGVLARVGGEDVGTYAINLGTLSLSTNYNLSFVPDNFEITQRAITVTVDAGQTKVYGALDPTFAYSITSGSLATGDSFSGALTRVVGEDVGTYAINQGTLSLSSNYDLSFASDNFEITQRAITVTVDAGQAKVYGDSDPVFTYTITSGSLVSGDVFSGALTRIVGESVGNYMINQGTLLLNSNYALSYVSNNFSITQKAITVTADDQIKERGTADPVFTYTITSGSLITGDAFTGTLSRIAGEDSGTYAITQGTLTAGSNYNLTFIEGTLTIEDTIAPDAPTITHISEYTCSGNLSMTSDNTLEISGTAERESTIEVFIEAISVGTVITDDNGFFTFDHSGTTLADGTYNITAQATDVAGNTGDVSSTFTITINTVDSDSDGIADFCDDDDDGNGVDDVDEDCDGDGIIDSQDPDNSACTSGIQDVKSYGFSPNGDGVNDGWTIENITAFPNNTVSVYSRSGKLVFKKKGYQNDWTGISNQISNSGNNSRLPVGPYIYVIDLGDGSKPTRGWLYINY